MIICSPQNLASGTLRFDLKAELCTASVADNTGMHRSDGLTRGKFAPNLDYPRASTPRQSGLQLLRGGAKNLR
jgi:hypothetical protein